MVRFEVARFDRGISIYISKRHVLTLVSASDAETFGIQYQAERRAPDQLGGHTSHASMTMR